MKVEKAEKTTNEILERVLKDHQVLTKRWEELELERRKWDVWYKGSSFPSLKHNRIGKDMHVMDVTRSHYIVVHEFVFMIHQHLQHN